MILHVELTVKSMAMSKLPLTLMVLLTLMLDLKLKLMVELILNPTVMVIKYY
jgi:hypothetical protein